MWLFRRKAAVSSDLAAAARCGLKCLRAGISDQLFQWMLTKDHLRHEQTCLVTRLTRHELGEASSVVAGGPAVSPVSLCKRALDYHTSLLEILHDSPEEVGF